jgi:hypothetical protein
MASSDYDPQSFKACTRRTVTFAVIFFSLGFILITMLLSILVDKGKNEAAQSAMNTVLPVSAGFIGSIMAFYFSDEASGNDDENEEEPLLRSVMFMKDLMPFEFKFDATKLDGTKKMKSVLEEVMESADDNKSLLTGDDLRFSYMAKGDKQVVHAEDFYAMTLKELNETKEGSDPIVVTLDSGPWANKTDNFA